ncbi:superinfection exclusion B family protein [Mesobacillus maritimus]|uniref:superinfection exclusion B family protein n=1 Tax=Mesobacillus maritimus TaxID=1643336 RepID=UPI00203DD22F|nr:superinfection exclusion B family protein [Mesobacillus maritimus]MCM3671657.1 superinfection exclusion B family protein [Mesobacillus maritimus]
MKIDFNIKDILTLPTTIMAALSLASGILLFFPTSILEKMYMIDFRDKFGFIIGIVFVVSISILIVNLIYQTASSISNSKAKRNFYATAEKRLQKLNNYQKSIVYALYQQDNRTLPLPLHDGAVLELEQNIMIGKATSQYMVDDLNNAFFPYLLHPWVSDELNNKPMLLSEFKNAFRLQNERESQSKVREKYW